MSYVVKEFGVTWKIYNTETKQYVNMKLSKEEANKIARKMNLGSGFGDWIPDFFNMEYPLVYK